MANVTVLHSGSPVTSNNSEISHYAECRFCPEAADKEEKVQEPPPGGAVLDVFGTFLFVQ